MADKKKAGNIVILDVRKQTFMTDYFMIVSGKSTRQNQATIRELKETAKAKGINVLGWEGYGEGSWVLLDLGDVVIHMLLEPVRNFYDLESIWAEAPKVKWQKAKTAKSK